MTRMPDWLQERLFERGTVLVTGRLDDALASQAAAQIMMLDATGDTPIDVVVDSGEGTLEAAFVLMDVMDAARATVRVRCRGRVEGPAVGVVAADDERSASPHTVFRVIAPSVAASGTTEQITAQSEAHRVLLWRFQARVAKTTGRPVEDVAEDMRKGRYLAAQEAVDCRLIDTIGS